MPKQGSATKRKRGRPKDGRNPIRDYANDEHISWPMRMLTTASADRGITLSMLARLTKRDIKSLTRSIEAPSPRPTTVALIARALGYPARVTSVLCDELRGSDADAEISVAIAECCNRVGGVRTSDRISAFEEAASLGESARWRLARSLVLAEHGFPDVERCGEYADARLDVLAHFLHHFASEGLKNVWEECASFLEDELSALKGFLDRMQVTVPDQKRILGILERYASHDYWYGRKIEAVHQRRQASAWMRERNMLMGRGKLPRE